MPMYRFRSSGDTGVHHELALGFYHDQAAVEHARKLSYRDPIEVWRDGELVARLERVTDFT